MSEIVVFDTETTGIPVWKEPSGGDNQPHIVELAAAVVCMDTREIKEAFQAVVAPDGWEIPDEIAEIHGITTERALEVGRPEREVLGDFLTLWGGRKRVAFNTTFDNRIIRIATKRFASDAVIDNWKGGEYECAMIGSRRVIGGKQPTLGEAYEHFFNREIENAHTAMGDVRATIDVYFAMKEARGEL